MSAAVGRLSPPGPPSAATTSPWPVALVAGVATVGATLGLVGGHGGGALVAVVGFVVLVGAAVCLRRRPEFTAALIVTFFAVQPALKFFVSVYFGPGKDALVLAVAGIWVSRLPRRRWRLHGRDRALALLTVVLLGLYVANPVGQHGAAWLDGTRLVLESFGLLLLGLGEFDARRAMRGAVGAVVVVGSLEAIYGVFQQAVGFAWIVTHMHYAFGDQVRTTSSGHLRSFGTFDDAFSYGSFELMALVTSFSVPLTRRRGLLLAVRALLVVGSVVAFVRTDWVVLAVLAVVALLRRLRRSAWLPVLGGAAAFGVAVLMSVSSAHVAAAGTAGHKSFLLSLNGRTLVWDQIVPTPFAVVGGDGVGRFGSGLARSQVHGIVSSAHYQAGRAAASSSVGDVQNIDSSYLATLADVGLPGLLLVLACGYRLAAVFVRGDRARDPLGAMGLGWLVVIGLDSLTRSSLTAFPSGFIELYLVGLAAAAVATVPHLPPREPLTRATWPTPGDRGPGPVGRLLSRRSGQTAPEAAALEVVPPADAVAGAAQTSVVTGGRSAGLSARRGVVSAVGSRLATKAIGLLLVLVLARHESPQRFAEYSYLLVTAGTLMTVTDLGVASIAAREVAGDLTAAARAYRAALGPQLATCSAAAVGAVLIDLAAPGPGVTIGPLAVVAAFIVVNGMFNLQAELLRASGRPGLEGALQIVSTVLQTALCSAIVLTDGSLLEVMAGILFSASVVAVAAQTALPWPARGDHQAMRRTLLRSGIWLGLGTTALAGMWRMSQIILSNTAPVGVVADYSAGVRFLDLGTSFSYTLGLGLLPALVRRARSSSSFTQHTRRLLGGVLAGSVVLVGPASLLAGPLSALLFGARYRGAGGSAEVFVLAAPAVVILYVAWFVLIAQHRERWGSAGAFLGLAVVVVASLSELGGGHGGARAAAWCTVAGAACCDVVLLTGALRGSVRGGRPTEAVAVAPTVAVGTA